MTERDQYIQQQVGPMLQPGEQILYMAQVLRQPPLWLQILCMGGLLTFLMTKAYFAAFTNRRLILIRTSMGLFGGFGMKNQGVEEIQLANVKSISTGGFLNNRSVTFVMNDGKSDTVRCAPWGKAVTGTAAFVNEMPGRFNNRQLPA